MTISFEKWNAPFVLGFCFGFLYGIVFIYLSCVSKPLNKYWASKISKNNFVRKSRYDLTENWYNCKQIQDHGGKGGNLSGKLCSEGQSFSSEVNGHHLKKKIFPYVNRASLVNFYFSVLTMPETRLHIPYASCEIMCAVYWLWKGFIPCQLAMLG